MGFARRLLRAALDLPIDKPAVREPPRSLAVRILKGTINFVADTQTNRKVDTVFEQNPGGFQVFGDYNDDND